MLVQNSRGDYITLDDNNVRECIFSMPAGRTVAHQDSRGDYYGCAI